MKVLIVLGSRNPKGQTARAAGALLQGVTSEGSQGEQIFLPQMNIERCRQCDDGGWGICRTEGRCVIEDDFALLVDKIKNSDAAVFASPVYFSDLTESMRAFTDRLRRTCMHDAGKDKIAGKPAIGICVAGGGGGGAPVCAVSLEKVLQRCGFDVVDMIPVRRQNLDMKVNILEITGKWLTTCPSSG
ncbi:flavodoxin family protein [bacterium]|nr:flavodoxin family protein [bacterium]